MSMMLKHAVDEAFERLSLLYGRDFTGKFNPDEIETVKGAWLFELQQIPMVLDRIAWALKHLNDRPPNAIQFANLCKSAPNAQQVAMLESTAPVRGPTPAELASLRALRDGIVLRKPSKQWAYELVAKHERGEHVDSYPLRCACDVVASDSRGTPPPAEDEPC